MLSHHEALTQIKAAKLVAILRHVPTEKLDGVVEALIAGGVRVLEFTFDHDDADCVKENAEKIRHTVEKYGGRVLVGCGTALTVQEVEAACDAGACLVISPNVDYGVIRRTRQLGMVSMPGALTPTEIVAAHGAGADIVKLFPAGTLGVIELSDFRLRHDIMFLFPKNSNFRADYTTIFRELRACAQPDGACTCPET